LLLELPKFLLYLRRSVLKTLLAHPINVPLYPGQS
jgi:hypothetical protein